VLFENPLSQPTLGLSSQIKFSRSRTARSDAEVVRREMEEEVAVARAVAQVLQDHKTEGGGLRVEGGGLRFEGRGLRVED